MARSYFTALVVSVGALVGSTNLYAVSPKKSSTMMPMGVSEGKTKDRGFLVSIPLVTERQKEARLHFEINAGDEFGLALEGSMLGAIEELPRDEVDKSGNSFKASGYQGSLFCARYSDGARLAGFFWALGAGYRQFDADWRRRPDKTESRASLTSIDDSGYLHHRLRGKGETGHVRLGYRWVAADWPIAIGAHVGVRHLNSKVEDVEVSKDDQASLHLQYSPTPINEKKSISRKEMTTRDIALDFGMVL